MRFQRIGGPMPEFYLGTALEEIAALREKFLNLPPWKTPIKRHDGAFSPELIAQLIELDEGHDFRDGSKRFAKMADVQEFNDWLHATVNSTFHGLERRIRRGHGQDLFLAESVYFVLTTIYARVERARDPGYVLSENIPALYRANQILHGNVNRKPWSLHLGAFRYQPVSTAQELWNCELRMAQMNAVAGARRLALMGWLIHPGTHPRRVNVLAPE